jgi:hypothetical protein
MLRKRTTKMPPEEGDHYIKYLTWSFEQTIKAATRQGKDRWIAVMDMNGCVSWPDAPVANLPFTLSSAIRIAQRTWRF